MFVLHAVWRGLLSRSCPKKMLYIANSCLWMLLLATLSDLEAIADKQNLADMSVNVLRELEQEHYAPAKEFEINVH